MCGLVGIAGNITLKEERAFKTLLILDSLRGEHSTGVAAVYRNKHDQPRLAKAVGSPFELFQDKRFEEALRKPTRILLGHNRYATQGAVNRHNAHPFEFDNVIGAHNGTLSSRYKLDDNKDFDVDSQALYNHVSNKGIEDAISKIEGAYALTWWDKEDETINFLRNKDRPLFMCHSKDKKCLFWASEKWMLSVALSRNDIDYGEIGELRQDLWVSIPVAVAGDMGESVDQKLESPKPYITTTSGATTSTATGTSTVVPFLPNSPKIPDGYLNVVGQFLEVVSSTSLSKGYKYYTLRDPIAPQIVFRMYTSKSELKNGDYILADMAGWSTTDGGFFRVNPVTWEFVELEEIEEDKKKLNS